MAANTEEKETEERRDGQDDSFSRRVFLRTLMWGSAGLFALLAGTASFAMFWPRKVTGFGAEITAGSLADFPVGTVTRIREGNFYISHVESGIIALYWQCTHLGCTVPWVEEEGRFHCPCHGSTFDRTGLNTGGPAPRPLDYMTVRLEGDTVIVDTGDIHTREQFSPDQVTPV